MECSFPNILRKSLCAQVQSELYSRICLHGPDGFRNVAVPRASAFLIQPDMRSDRCNGARMMSQLRQSSIATLHWLIPLTWSRRKVFAVEMSRADAYRMRLYRSSRRRTLHLPETRLFKHSKDTVLEAVAKMRFQLKVLHNIK